MKQARVKENKFRNAKAAEKRKLFLISIPFLIFITAFSYVPLLGWVISFFIYYPGIPFSKMEFVGLKNFEAFFYNKKQVITVVRNTFVLSGLIILTLPLPAIFAILLNEIRNLKFKKLVQTFSTIPYFISYVLLYLAFTTILSPSDGMLNTLLVDNLGILDKPLNVLTNEKIAWTVQTATYLFKNLGYNAILYLSAIASIDTQLYEAAEVDGAGRFDKIWHITVPGLLPTFVVLLVLQIGSVLSGAGFEQYYVFGNGMIMDKLEVIDTYTYKMGIVQGNYSFGTAMSMMKSVLSVGLMLIANTLVKKIRGSSIF
ncbi:MAG: sugar ABC transporter permease [Lachnospiraceae bacterium]|nr:sugar ABC transporter permease [Lachnospiraceae bacterium]